MKLPVLSGEELIKILKKIGYVPVRQRGSHVRLIHKYKRAVIVPLHKEIGKGLLKKIMRDAEISPEELERLIKEM